MFYGIITKYALKKRETSQIVGALLLIRKNGRAIGKQKLLHGPRKFLK